MESKNTQDAVIKIELTNNSTLIEITGHPLELLADFVALFSKNEQVDFLMNTGIKLADVIKREPNFGQKKYASQRESYPDNAEVIAIMHDFAEWYSNYISKKG